MKINYYLKAAEATQKRIYIYLSHQGQRWPAPTGISITPDLWDARKQRIKSKAPQARYQNKILDKIRDKVIAKYWKVISKHSRAITAEEYRATVLKAAGRQPTKAIPKTNFITYARAYYDSKLRIGEIKESSYKISIGQINVLEEFHKRHPFTFEDIDTVWMERFIAYGAKRGWKQNTSWLYLTLIKSIMKKAEQEQLHKNKSYPHLKIKKEKLAKKIYLSMADLERIYRYNPQDQYLVRTRNIFLIGALTGLRYTDVFRLKSDRIRMNHDGVKVIDLTTTKTGAKVSLPVHPIVEEILTQAGGTLRQMNNDRANIYLKELFKEAGYKDIVYQSHKVDNKRTETRHETWELITTHTARRSFATNCHLAGIMINDIKALMGHSSIKQTEQYICATASDAATIVSKNTFYAGFHLRPA